ncbi:MAG TPA: hypothetical protein VGZ52_09415 [Acidimicrobiales bacterium]|nr:hypothetical protein [Acidimicrobiales bacterium]
MTVRAWQRQFLTSVSALSVEVGMPPSILRVFAWMIVCEPVEQSAEQLRDALALSAGSVSAATTMLVRAGMVERARRPGERRLYYRVRDDAWEQVLRQRIEATSHLRSIADTVLARAPGDQHRLRDMRSFYASMEKVLRAGVRKP